MSSRTSIYTDGFYQRTSMTLTNFLELKSRSLMQNSLFYYRHYKTTIVTIPRIFPRIGGHNTASKEPLRHFHRIHKAARPSAKFKQLLFARELLQKKMKIAVHMYVEQRQHYSLAILEFKSFQTVLNSMRGTAVHTDSGPRSRKMECHDQKL